MKPAISPPLQSTLITNTDFTPQHSITTDAVPVSSAIGPNTSLTSTPTFPTKVPEETAGFPSEVIPQVPFTVGVGDAPAPTPALSTTGTDLPHTYQLRDIHGLDPVPWWPLAMGWWLLFGMVAISLWLGRHRLPLLHNNTISNLAWRWDAARQLRALRRRTRRQETWLTASELSTLLRRIAIANYGRDACAGLTGTAWLEWLLQHDPAGFPWPERGQLLQTMPYAPPNTLAADPGDLLELIDATRTWLNRAKQPPKGLIDTSTTKMWVWGTHPHPRPPSMEGGEIPTKIAGATNV